MAFPTELAREDWIAGVPIVLDDGGEYHFPTPRREYKFDLADPNRPLILQVPTEDTNRKYTQAFFDSQAPLLAHMEDMKARNMEGFDLFDWIRLVFPVAVDLLRRNYSIDDEMIRDLMPYAPGDDRNFQMWRDLSRVAGHRSELGPELGPFNIPDPHPGVAPEAATQSA